MKPADRAEFFPRLRSVLPHPRTELEYRTPFELLVAVILSAQATDAGVNKATRRLYPVANTPQAFLELGPKSLKDASPSTGSTPGRSRSCSGTIPPGWRSARTFSPRRSCCTCGARTACRSRSEPSRT